MRNMGWMVLAASSLAACGGGAGNDAGGAMGDATGTNMSTGVPASADPSLPHGDAIAAGATAPVRAEAEPAFAGTWTGPEGLSFVVTRLSDGRYRVRNRDTLDTEQTFDAEVAGPTLRFVRRSEPRTARAGTGAETGFKWLAGKKDCLIVETGVEGYCRD